MQALSPEVRDLLDQIFKVDPKKRITVRGIMQHPWYNKQLPAKYQDALDRIEEQQAVLEKHVQQIQLDPVPLSPFPFLPQSSPSCRLAQTGWALDGTSLTTLEHDISQTRPVISTVRGSMESRRSHWR